MSTGLPVSPSVPMGAGTSPVASGLGYPLRLVVAFAVLLVLAVLWLVWQPATDVAWGISALVVLSGLTVAAWYTHRLVRAQQQSAQVLAALGAITADIPVRLRTRMPLVLVTGDGLPAIFNRARGEQFAYIGEGAIWLRVDRPQDLPWIAAALRQWRDGRAPDAIVLSVAPALYAGEDALTQNLRVVRQARADAVRMLGTTLPGYIAVYQPLTAGPSDPGQRHWYGVSSTTRIVDGDRFSPVVLAAEREGTHASAERAACLASVVAWTQRVVLGALADRQQPASPWTLFGAGWIDCGPAGTPGAPWERDVEMLTGVTRAPAASSATPWPLPQPLIEAMPQRAWMSPRIAALTHALVLLACALAFACWGAARHNRTLLTRIGADLECYSMIPVSQDAARRDALGALVADRNELSRYAQVGVPLHLSFGMYRGTALIAVLNKTIASYQPPPLPPEIVTLDSMSLFDSGRAQLKTGSNRVMVAALEMIKAHPGKRILVTGYTDNVGDAQSNVKLSTARAEAVREWLVDASGIESTQFAIQGYGDTRPVANNDTDEGRARNRRVEITLVPDARPVPR
jgi:outer membrane protein OmpA-like peptidoglycan-associated protein